MGKQAMRLLVVKPSSFGDIVQMLQVMEGAARAAENTECSLEIHWVVRDLFADFLQLSPFVSRLFLFDRQGGVRGFWRLMREIRTVHYDCIIDGQGLLRSGLMTFFARGTLKVGRKDAREGSRLFYHRSYGVHRGAHAVDVLQDLMRVFPFKSHPQRPLTLRMPVLRFAIPSASILLFPNSRGAEKEWPFFYELTERLLKETPYHCVWVGQGMPAHISPHDRLINLMGQTSLADVVALVQSAACVVANDSGPIHLAAALQKPLVGLYGPTDGRRYGPYPPDQHCILQAPNGHLKQLTVDRVCQAILKVLQTHR
jgi:ADP-heptose:LPS heptosyltransferase